MSHDDLSADRVIALLGLERHPEGGAFRETFKDPHTDTAGRAHVTAIYYLLQAGERSHWHRVDASEVWHHYAGAPLTLAISRDGRAVERVTLGADLESGERPQAVVPAGAWQSASSNGAWTLAGCTVAPGFTFDGFALAPTGWTPGNGPPQTGD